jgi:hypothetical protein
LASLLALGGQSFADLCTIDAVPAATLLLPYFEAGLTSIPSDDVASATAVDTLFSVNNASAAPTVAHVTMWGDWSKPSIDFDIFLTGYDVQTVSLADVFNNGNLPLTAHATNDPLDLISPHGTNPAWDSNPDNIANPLFPGCDGNLPLATMNPVLDSDFLDRIRCGHTGRGLGCASLDCIGEIHDAGDNDFIARGYITLDNVLDCNLLFPDQPGYFGSGGVASSVNQLWGNWQIIRDGQASGDNLVSIEADPNGVFFLPGDYTFYGRYVALAEDQREPLASTWGTNYLQPNVVFDGGTTLQVWRDSKCADGASGYDNGCVGGLGVAGDPPWYPLNETQVVAFDFEENATLICQSITTLGGGGISPPPFDVTDDPFCFPLETGAYVVGDDPLLVPYDGGWMYLNLNFTLDSLGACSTDGLFGDIAQSWVTTELSASGGGIAGDISVGFAATQFTSACSDANPIIGGNLP